MKIRLPCYEIEMTITDKGGKISSTLKETCPCGSPESKADARRRIEFNRVMDGIESLILAHACAGIDVTSPAYIEGIETAVEAAANNAD